MYLFVFIFVMMSVLGLYTELFSLRIAHIMANQKAIAEAMMVWHGAAYYLAKDNITAWVIPPAGCSVTAGSALANCGATLSLAADGIKNRVYLPIGYAYGEPDLRFETRVYSVGTARYIVTFVLSGSTHLGFTHTQIYQQMVTARLPEVSYGHVSVGTCQGGTPGTWLMTRAYMNTTQLCYSVLSSGNTVVPVGSVGIISIL